MTCVSIFLWSGLFVDTPLTWEIHESFEARLTLLKNDLFCVTWCDILAFESGVCDYTSRTDDNVSSMDSCSHVGQHLILNMMCWKIKQIQIIVHWISSVESITGADYSWGEEEKHTALQTSGE